jgi:manganese-dependent inorganic pyrophosphatase
MLLSGLLSDTLIFNSPTTTPRDRAAGTWLAWMAFGVDEAESQLQAYGEELLRAGADMVGRTAQDMITADFKAFESGKTRFGVSQIEVTSFMSIADRVGDIRAALNNLRELREFDFAALMVTDITSNTSMLVAAGNTKTLERLPFSRKGEGVWDLPGMVSRKKQLLPTMLGILQG